MPLFSKKDQDIPMKGNVPAPNLISMIMQFVFQHKLLNLELF